jgi:aryl-alcohol dehydrogenase-like predicted oxidoreductase
MLFKQVNSLGFSLSQLGLGTWQFSGDAWGHKSREECLEGVKTAIECGITYFDTALEYGDGRSEIILGEALKGLNDIVISTKIPPKNGEWSPGPNKPIDDFFPSEWIIKCCETSLKNLKREYIDVLFLHTWNVSWGHETKWHETMELLRKQGKIRSIGISVSDSRASEANIHLENGRVDLVQVVYNLFEQEPQFTLFPLCQKHNVSVIARCPLSSGVLSGSWHKDMQFDPNDWRRKWTSQTWLTEQITMADYLKPVAEKANLSMSELAMLFVLHNPAVTSTIFGSTNTLHIRQNTKALEKAISKELIVEIKNLWTDKKIYGVYNGG